MRHCFLKIDFPVFFYPPNNSTINKKNSPWEMLSHPPKGGVRPSLVEQNWASSTGDTGAPGRKRPPGAAMAPVSTASAAAAA